jgi:predicted RNA-binding protein with PUA-like domain
MAGNRRRGTKKYWLVKSDPDEYGWGDLVRDGRTPWDGVRNHQARNNLADMRPGDPVLVYHSGKDREVVGQAEVLTDPYPDPTADDDRWAAVDLQPVRALDRPVSLHGIKDDPKLQDLALVKQSRLSVMRVKRDEFEHLLSLGRGR